VAENVRQHVAELGIPHATPSRRVTISCGVAFTMPRSGLSLDVLLRSADHALYEAKAAGRDLVVVGKYGNI
jgi:diguanylate cyclase (GGDEF)-like protein